MPNKDDPSDVEARAVAAELCACSVFGCAFDEDPVPGSEKWGLLHRVGQASKCCQRVSCVKSSLQL